MIIDLFLNVLLVIVEILLAPLGILSIGIDFIASFEIVQNFINVIAYLMPFSMLTPLIVFIISMFMFRSIVSLIKTIWDLLPIL